MRLLKSPFPAGTRLYGDASSVLDTNSFLLSMWISAAFPSKGLGEGRRDQ